MHIVVDCKDCLDIDWMQGVHCMFGYFCAIICRRCSSFQRQVHLQSSKERFGRENGGFARGAAAGAVVPELASVPRCAMADLSSLPTSTVFSIDRGVRDRGVGAKEQERGETNPQLVGLDVVLYWACRCSGGRRNLCHHRHPSALSCRTCHSPLLSRGGLLLHAHCLHLHRVHPRGSHRRKRCILDHRSSAQMW